MNIQSQPVPPLTSLTKILLSTPALILLVLLSVFGLSAWLPLFDLDEGAFTTATREMLETGNWISTYMNGVPRHDKPILIYWCQAISASIFGLNPFGLRLPSQIAAIGWIYISYRFVREFRCDQEARLMVWLLACLPVASIIFKAAIADALLNFFLCGAFFEIYRYYHYVKPGDIEWNRLIKIGLWLGFGFLTKGPVACILPLSVSLILFICTGRLLDWIKAVLNPISLAVVLAVILPWHIASYIDQGWEFFEGFYLKHNLDRFSNTMESHGGKPWYYIVLLPILVAPFSHLLWPVIKQVSESIFNDKHPLIIYCVAWFVVVLAIFSFSKTQLPHYLLYGLTPLLILMSRYVLTVGFWGVVVPAITLLCLAILPALLPLAVSHIDKPFDHAVAVLAAEEYMGGYIVLTIIFMVIALAVLWLKQLSVTARSLIAMAAVMLALNFLVMPIVAVGQQQPVREAAAIAKQYDKPVVSYGINMPSFTVYVNRIVPRRAPKYGELVFTRIDNQQTILDLDKAVTPKIIYAKGGVVLFDYE